jgi:hypothetical protein
MLKPKIINQVFILNKIEHKLCLKAKTEVYSIFGFCFHGYKNFNENTDKEILRILIY